MKNYHSNPNFPDEVGMYLEANGFIQGNSEKKNISFFKDDLALIVNGDTVEFLALRDEEYGHSSKEFCTITRYSGITNIPGIFEWMLLFHITGFVRIQDFIAAARKENVIQGPASIINLLDQSFIAVND